MASPPLRRLLQGRFWEHNPPLRRWLRRLKTRASVVRHRIRCLAGRKPGPRVVSIAEAATFAPIPHPAIAFVDGPGTDLSGIANQTETSIVTASGASDDTPFLAHSEGMQSLPAVHLEAMLLAAAAEDPNWVVAGWAAPAAGPHGPSGVVGQAIDVPRTTHILLRSPSRPTSRQSQVTGRAVSHITTPATCAELAPLEPFGAVGAHRLRPDALKKAVVSHPWHPVDEVLAGLPAMDGPPTALFLLPFLAVGGAERLLYELLDPLKDRTRLLVVTTDPHLESLGQTVDRARELTPHVYTLGDWLPRPAIPSALRHLIRRWRVESLVCWNGSVLFYDEASALRRSFPDMRIVNQLFNHRGGWIEHFSPSIIDAVDTQIAVNTPIARALVGDRGVPAERVATIHHAVGVPDPCNEGRRSQLRRELGVSDDTTVIGTFIRMHPQKRPLDIVRIARLMRGDPVHFLLVGGGPLDAELDAEIARDHPPNLTRWPMRDDASPLYDALDLCLMTSDYEGLPVFLLDGLARGLPGVATAVGDIPLLFEDGGGELVEEPGSLDAFATAIRGLLDPETRRAAGAKGRDSVQSRFGLDRYVAAYESVIFPNR